MKKVLPGKINVFGSTDSTPISKGGEVQLVELIDSLGSLNNGGQFLQYLSQIWATVHTHMLANAFNRECRGDLMKFLQYGCPPSGGMTTLLPHNMHPSWTESLVLLEK